MGYVISGKGMIAAISRSASTAKDALEKAAALRKQGLQVTIKDSVAKVVTEKELKDAADGA
jgi:hypothetical protein